MRHLKIIPIIHSRHDLGSLEQSVRIAKSQSMRESAVEKQQNVVDQFWSQLQAGIEGWGLEYAKTILYQDALPFTGHPEQIIEHKIVQELAAKGSTNHLILKWLLEKGAHLRGTESPELLLKEYEAVKKALSQGLYSDIDEPADVDPNVEAKFLLEKRDRFIADRISETLPVDHIGILFVGLQHRVQDFLPDDVDVDFPFGKPRDNQGVAVREARAS
ncbi:hypothetical protein SH449x_004574 [Pirellulaceae bacterium SH449]